jgi:hypothetical protein
VPLRLWSKIEVDVSTMHWGANQHCSPAASAWADADTCVVAPTIAKGGMHTVLLVAPGDLGLGLHLESAACTELHALPEGHEVVVYTATYRRRHALKGQPQRWWLVKVVTGSVSTVVIRPVPLALCSLFNHCCNPNMVCGTGRRARCSGGAAPRS